MALGRQSSALQLDQIAIALLLIACCARASQIADRMPAAASDRDDVIDMLRRCSAADVTRLGEHRSDLSGSHGEDAVAALPCTTTMVDGCSRLSVRCLVSTTIRSDRLRVQCSPPMTRCTALLWVRRTPLTRRSIDLLWVLGSPSTVGDALLVWVCRTVGAARWRVPLWVRCIRHTIGSIGARLASALQAVSAS